VVQAVQAEQGRRDGVADGAARRLARGLGWFSLGLGAAQIAAPGRVAQLIGVRDQLEIRATMRAAGVREIAHGVGLLSRSRPVGWAWSRVAGDAMDLTLLGKAMSSNDNDRRRVAAATAAVSGITVIDLVDSTALTRSTDGAVEGGVRAKAAITVNRPVEEVYLFWHDFENLPRFMSHLQSVSVTGDRRSRWKAKAPAGMEVEWDAEIVGDAVNEYISWHSLEGADVNNSGIVSFAPAPGGRGTEVRVELQYGPPGGKLGSVFARLFGEEPSQQMRDDLRRFKQVIEAGEVVRSEATPEGPGARGFLKQRPAQPLP
jgi:uncharacterized membrane protein